MIKMRFLLLGLLMFLVACSSESSPSGDADEDLASTVVCSDNNMQVLQENPDGELTPVQNCLCDECACPSCSYGACLIKKDFCDFRATACEVDEHNISRILVSEPQRSHACCEETKRTTCPAATMCNSHYGCVADLGAVCISGTITCSNGGESVQICRLGEWEALVNCPCGCESGSCRSKDMGRCAYEFTVCANRSTENRLLQSGLQECCAPSFEYRCEEGMICSDEHGGCWGLPKPPADGDTDIESDLTDTPSDQDQEPDGPVTVTKVGSVYISETESYVSVDQIFSSASVSAHFSEIISTPPSGISVGSCTVYPYDANAQTHTAIGLNGGLITITGLSVDPVNLTPAEDSTYGWLYQSDLSPGTSNLFNGGETASISTIGGMGVRAFSANIQAVQPMTGFAPDLFAEAFTLSLAALPSFAWTSQSGSRMTFTLSVFSYNTETSTTDGVTIICQMEDSGTFQFPVGLDTHFPLDPTTISLTMGRTQQTSQDVHDATIHVSTAVYRVRTWSSF